MTLRVDVAFVERNIRCCEQ